jgi:hypothetical protein
LTRDGRGKLCGMRKLKALHIIVNHPNSRRILRNTTIKGIDNNPALLHMLIFTLNFLTPHQQPTISDAP